MDRLPILIVTLGAATAQAQTHFGLRAGWGQCDYSGDELFAMERRNGFHLGGAFSVGDPGDNGLSLELLLSTRGGRKVDTDLGYYGLPAEPVADHSLTYLDVPLMFRLNLIAEGLYFESGLYAAFLLGAKVSGPGVSSAQVDRITDGYKGTNFGFITGFGYVHASGIGASLRGSLSFGDAYTGEPPATPVYNADEVRKTQFLLLQVGLLYYFGVERR